MQIIFKLTDNITNKILTYFLQEQDQRISNLKRRIRINSVEIAPAVTLMKVQIVLANIDMENHLLAEADPDPLKATGARKTPEAVMMRNCSLQNTETRRAEIVLLRLN